MTQAVSRRTYAKRRNVTEGAIRKRIADGSLADAMTPDGLIDPDKADALLAANTTAGRDISSDLVAAKRRKAAAACALLEGEVRDFGATLVPTKDVAAIYLQVVQEIARQFLRIGGLAAERVAIATYSEIIRWLGDDDPTTRRMMEEILAKEEEHADDLARLLEPSPRKQATAQVQPLPVGRSRLGTQ